jgi:hypothetical protein
MCYYFETFHVYTGCHLHALTPGGTPTRFAAFLGLVLPGRADADAEAEAKDEEPEFHPIAEKVVIQCEVAVKNPELKDVKEEERVCPDAKPAMGGEMDDLVENRLTTQKGNCPVCERVEEVVKEECNKTVIVCSAVRRRDIMLMGC